MARRMWYAAAAGLALAGAVGIVGRRRPDRPGTNARTSGAVRVADPRSRHRVLPRPRHARPAERAGLHPARRTLSPARPRDGRQRGPRARRGDRAPFARAPAAGGTSEASGVLASSLLGQHRFAEALEAAAGAARGGFDLDRGARPAWPRPSSSSDATTRPARLFGMLASYQGDLGRRATTGSLGRAAWPARGSATAPRARRGTQARRRHGMPREQVAWFDLRLGDLALRAGQLDEAERELEAGLEILPGDYRLLGTLARARTPIGTTGASRPTPASSPYPGRSTPPRSGCCTTHGPRSATRRRPQEYYRAMAVAVLRQPGPYHRAWSLFLLDHDREVPRVLGEGRGGAPHPAGHLRLRPARLGAPQVGQGRRGPGADGARALPRHARRDAVLSTPA